MKILVVTINYFPEPARITDICEELVKRGHDVTVITDANVGGIPELIEPGKTGELFRMDDAEDLEAKIRMMLGRDYSFDVEPIRGHFSKDHYLEQMMSVYR